MVEAVEQQSVDLGTKIVEAEEEIKKIGIDKKLLRKQAIEENDGILSFLKLIAGAEVFCNFGAYYLNFSPRFSLVMNAILAFNLLYFSYVAYKSIKSSYNVLVDRYESSID